MIQDRRTSTAGQGAALPFERSGYERPVDHLHFDRHARVWRSHTELPSATTRPVTAETIHHDGVRE